MKHNYLLLAAIAFVIGLAFAGCKKQEQEALTPKITNDKVETTATTATFTWTVDWPGKLISVVEVSENEDMSHSQFYGSEEETENHTFAVTVSELTRGTKYYYRYLVWNHFYVDNKFVMAKKGFYGGCVDLGLPSGLLWAVCNVGANVPEDNGDYLAWGETQSKIVYNWSSYKYSCGTYNTLTKYCNKPSWGDNGFTDNLTTLQTSDDAATANLGGRWCTPTEEQWEELKNNTTITWTTLNGVKGREFTASNGCSLFLPAAGYREDDNLIDVGNSGHYWSSSLNTNYPDNAQYMGFDIDSDTWHNYNRQYGQSVRPVLSGTYTSKIENVSE